jgi:hypothetical protein
MTKVGSSQRFWPAMTANNRQDGLNDIFEPISARQHSAIASIFRDNTNVMNKAG